MMDNKTTHDLFIKNFVLKDRRDRVQYLLNDSRKRGEFIQKLNHQWDDVLDMRFISKIPPGIDDFEFAKKELKIR